MKSIDYNELITKLENGNIRGVKFSIKDYSHYRKCSIYRKNVTLDNGNEVNMVCVDPVTDLSESVCFYRKFNEPYKLFNLGKNKKYTLKQIWNRVQIIEIDT